MLIIVVALGFLAALWQLAAVDRRVRRLTLEVLKLKARVTDSDRRQSKRLFELTTPIRRIEKRIGDASIEWLQELDEVLPSDVDPEGLLNSVDWAKLNSLTLEEIEAL